MSTLLIVVPDLVVVGVANQREFIALAPGSEYAAPAIKSHAWVLCHAYHQRASR
jgi:hypothetical protein